MGNEIQVRLAENIRRIRKEKRLTQFELAEKAGISEAMVKSIETCHAWPSENTLLQLSNALESDIYHFFMPVASSIVPKQELTVVLRKTIKDCYCNLVNDMLNDLA